MVALSNIVFMMTDQPTTCPDCGSRTEIISDFLHTNAKSQINKCLAKDCQKIFIEVEDIEFLNEQY